MDGVLPRNGVHLGVGDDRRNAGDVSTLVLGVGSDVIKRSAEATQHVVALRVDEFPVNLLNRLSQLRKLMDALVRFLQLDDLPHPLDGVDDLGVAVHVGLLVLHPPHELCGIVEDALLVGVEEPGHLEQIICVVQEGIFVLCELLEKCDVVGLLSEDEVCEGNGLVDGLSARVTRAESVVIPDHVPTCVDSVGEAALNSKDDTVFVALDCNGGIELPKDALRALNQVLGNARVLVEAGLVPLGLLAEVVDGLAISRSDFRASVGEVGLLLGHEQRCDCSDVDLPPTVRLALEVALHVSHGGRLVGSGAGVQERVHGRRRGGVGRFALGVELPHALQNLPDLGVGVYGVFDEAGLGERGAHQLV